MTPAGEIDNPVSLEVLAILLCLAGMGVFLMGDGVRDKYLWHQTMNVALTLCITGAIVMMVGAWQPRVATWLTLVVTVATVHLSAVWLGMPALLTLSVLPIILACILMNTHVALFVTIAETLLLWQATRQLGPGADLVSVCAAGAVDWVILGGMFVMYHRFYQHDVWLWEHYERAHKIMEEARDDKVRLEESQLALAHANRQLVLANERASRLRTIAEASEKTKTMFVSKVSHEFRTPLNMIIGLVGLMMDEQVIPANELPANHREDLRVVYRNCEHLSNMINDVLSLSQIESGRLVLHKERVDLAVMVREAAKVIHPLVEMKAIELAVHIPPGLPQVYCDRTRIQQVILNLLSNAARFTERGKITVCLECADERVVVRVTDTGPGISAEDVERIFEPFSQGTGEMWRDKKGSGLGLSISKQFVNLHGGRMWLESELGVGSSFIFELPVSPSLQPISSAKGWIKEDWVWRESSFNPSGRDGTAEEQPKRRIVVCDETGGLLNELERYTDMAEFVKTHDWKQARQCLQECPAHAVLLNVRDSNELWERLETEREEVPHTPIIGCCVPRAIQHALEVGAVDYLVKPVLRRDLQRILQNLNGAVTRVLIVDDDLELVNVIARMLQICDSSLQVTAASSGEEALAELRAGGIDLMLLDIVLPDMDGWQLLSRKDTEREIQDIPVVIVSAQDPGDHLATSNWLFTTMGQGLSLSQLLRCSLGLPDLLLPPG